MMTGTVTARREAILSLTLLEESGREHPHDAVIDTGYNGWLTLPPSAIASLGFSWQRFGRAILADGSEKIFSIYEGVVIWDGQPVTIDIDELDGEPLVGMSLMYGYELILPILHGAIF